MGVKHRQRLLMPNPGYEGKTATKRLDKRPDQWLIDNTHFNNNAVADAKRLPLTQRTPAEVRALARRIASEPVW